MADRDETKTLDLTLEQLTVMVGQASGWGDGVSITFATDYMRHVVPHKRVVTAGVTICGDKGMVSGTGVDHRAALVALLQNLEMHHREVLRWHRARCEEARKILDEHGIYYTKLEL